MTGSLVWAVDATHCWPQQRFVFPLNPQNCRIRCRLTFWPRWHWAPASTEGLKTARHQSIKGSPPPEAAWSFNLTWVDAPRGSLASPTSTANTRKTATVASRDRILRREVFSIILKLEQEMRRLVLISSPQKTKFCSQRLSDDVFVLLSTDRERKKNPLHVYIINMSYKKTQNCVRDRGQLSQRWLSKVFRNKGCRKWSKIGLNAHRFTWNNLKND